MNIICQRENIAYKKLKKEIEYEVIIGMSNKTATQSIFKVKGSTGNTYNVDIENNTCTCPHYIHRLTGTRQDCKHIKIVKQNRTDDGTVLQYGKKPTFQERAAQAIYQLKECNGSSRQAIKAFLQLDSEKFHFLNKALAKGVKSGFFIMNKGKYKLAANIKKESVNKHIIKVKGSTGNMYDIDLVNKTCSCPHYVHRLAGTDKLCKHLEDVNKRGLFVIENKEEPPPVGHIPCCPCCFCSKCCLEAQKRVEKRRQRDGLLCRCKWCLMPGPDEGDTQKREMDCSANDPELEKLDDLLCREQAQTVAVNQKNNRSDAKCKPMTETDGGGGSVFLYLLKSSFEKMSLDERQQSKLFEQIQEYREYNRLKRENDDLRIRNTELRMKMV